MSALEESFIDDVQQKLAINRAVYAAGYGIDPRPYAQRLCHVKSSWLPWVLLTLVAGVGVGVLAGFLMNRKPSQTTVNEGIPYNAEFFQPKGGDP